MKYSSRFFLYAPLALFLGIACWVMAHWWIAAGALDKKLTALNGHQAVPGITLSYATKTISGFPFRLDVVFTGFGIKGAGAHGPFAWSTEKFAMHALTYGRTQDIYEAAGRQSLSWTDVGGQAQRLNFLPATMRGSAIVDAKGLARFDLDILDAGGTDQDGVNFTVGRAQLHIRRAPTLDIMVSLDEAQLGLIHIRSLRDYLTLSQDQALAPLLAGEQSWPDAVMAWRTAGGGVKQGKREIAPKMDAARVAAEILNPLF
jgi:hypothetical protein